MNDKQESTMSLIAALMVLFTALLAPPVSAGLAIFLLVAFAVYKYAQSQRASS